MSHVYVVPGTVQRVIDGDTIRAQLDLGWNITLATVSIRLTNIDCPERATDAGKAAAAFTAALLPPGTAIVVSSHTLDKYGRVLGDVRVAGRDLSAALLNAGHAVPYTGGRRTVTA